MIYADPNYRNNLICYNLPVYKSEYNCDPSWTKDDHTSYHSNDKDSLKKTC